MEIDENCTILITNQPVSGELSSMEIIDIQLPGDCCNQFQENLVVWKFTVTALFVLYDVKFQENLVVWKLCTLPLQMQKANFGFRRT